MGREQAGQLAALRAAGQNGDGVIAVADGRMKHQLELRHFSALIALSEAGTIGGAARALGVAQSTLSETLLSLERSLGAPALERHPGGAPRLTKVAERLLPHARSILQATKRAQMEALTARSRINVGTVESLSTRVLPFVLGGFHRAHPCMDVQVTTGLCESLHRELTSGCLDLIFTMEASLTRSTGSSPRADVCWTRAIRSVPLVLIGGSYARDTLAPPLTIHLPDPAGALHDVVERWAASWASRAKILSAGTMDAVRQHLAAGDGVSVLPYYVVAEYLHAGSLRMLEPPVALPHMTVFASAPVGSALRDPVEHMCGQVKERLDGLLADYSSGQQTGRSNHAR